MKGTYVFEQGPGNGPKQTMILDDLVLYIPQGAQFERATFADEKTAAQAFNRVMMARFSPRAGWKILEKRMGEAVPPPPERMVGYVAPAATKNGAANLSQSPIHISNDHLIIAVETAPDADIAKALTTQRKTVQHLCLYARFKATAGLAALLKHPWPGLATLVIDAFDNTMTRQASCKVGDLSVVLPAVPDVRRLYAAGQLGFLNPIKHAAVEHMSLLGNPLPTRALEGIGGSSFPALKRLDLAIATEAAPDEGWLDALTKMLGSLRPLDALTLEGPFDPTEVLRAIAPLGKKAPKELRLMSAPRDEDELIEAARALAKAGAACALVLPEGELVEETLKELRAVLPRVEENDTTAFLPEAYGSATFLGEG